MPDRGQLLAGRRSRSAAVGAVSDHLRELPPQVLVRSERADRLWRKARSSTRSEICHELSCGICAISGNGSGRSSLPTYRIVHGTGAAPLDVRFGGQKRKCRRFQVISALPHKADIKCRHCDVRFVPITDIASLDNRLKSEDESAFELVSISPVAPPRIRAFPKLSAGQHPRRI